MKINAGEIRVGMLLEYKDDLWQVLKTQHVKPGKGGAFAQVEMKSVIKNTKLNEDLDLMKQLKKHQLRKSLLHFFMRMRKIIILWIQKTLIKLRQKKF